MTIAFAVTLRIRRPVTAVFEAVADPQQLSLYFTNGGASAPLEPGASIEWKFRDDLEHPVTVPVTVVAIERNRSLELAWPACEWRDAVEPVASETAPDPVPETAIAPAGFFPAAYDTRVRMAFEAVSPVITRITIEEGTWRETDDALQGSYESCQRWMHFACSLKAHLEYGVNLRRGSF